MSKKAEAVALLERYDALRAEALALEQTLNKACSEYGRELGVWGFGPSHLRTRLRVEREGKVT